MTRIMNQEFRPSLVPQSPSKTFSFDIEVTKEDSSFVYFILEASEGLCFYSTLATDKNRPSMRTLKISGHQSTYKEVRDAIHFLQSKMPLTQSKPVLLTD